MARGCALVMTASPVAMMPRPRCFALRRARTAAAAAAHGGAGGGGGGGAAAAAGGVFREHDEEVRSGGVMPRASASASLAPVEAIEEEIPGTSYRAGASSSSSSLSLNNNNGKKNSRRDARSRTGGGGGRRRRQAHRGTTVKKLKIAIDIDDGTCVCPFRTARE